ncbi:sulfurtransferase [Clostridium sp. CAG:440]|nr:sulfurtransferase [Clostridium sp. CAG:440]
MKLCCRYQNRCCGYDRCQRYMEPNDITMEQLKNMQMQGAILIDIRSPQEYNEGHLEGAIVLPEYEIYSKAKKILPNKNQTIIVYCGNGIRSKKSQRIMRRMGYTNVYNLYKGTENY